MNKKRNYAFYLNDEEHQHILNLKRKYGCKTKSEVISKLLEIEESSKKNTFDNVLSIVESMDKKLKQMDKVQSIHSRLTENIANKLLVDPQVKKEEHLYDYFEYAKQDVENEIKKRQLHKGRKRYGV